MKQIKFYPLLLIIGGIIGLLASFMITIDKIELLKNPTFQSPCNINPVISCGSIMKSSQAEVFGFANPLLGLIGFSVVITIGMALLSGAKFKRWFWLGLEGGAILGLIFVHWLISQSLYIIGALCPYCMIVWTVTIPIFFYTTLYNLHEGYIKLPKALRRVGEILQKYHATILFVWYALIVVAILIRFWYYWRTLI